MLNKIILMGRPTHDPELRRTQNGTAVTGFSLAVERDFKDEDGKRATDFIDIVAWRAAAEFVAKYFTKGRMAVVEGRLQIHDWRTRTATTGTAPRWWPTISISETAGRTPLHRQSRCRRSWRKSCRTDLPQRFDLLERTCYNR